MTVRCCPMGSFCLRFGFDLLDDGAIDGVDRAGGLDLASIFVMFGVCGKLGAIDLVFGHGAYVDGGERFTCGTGKLGWCVVTGDASAALRDGLEHRCASRIVCWGRSCTSGTRYT
jgi:hypothetical protein